MKDSQDWLDEILDKLKLFTKTPLGRMTPEQDEATLDWRQAKSAIREHFLKEALEMLDSMPKLILKGKIEDDMGLFGDYIEVAELRNKFNDKYKED